MQHTKFKVAVRSNGLGGDTFSRNLTDTRKDGRTDQRDGPQTDLSSNLIHVYPFFLKKKAGIKMS